MDWLFPLTAIFVTAGSGVAAWYLWKRPPLPALSSVPLSPIQPPSPTTATVRSVNEPEESAGGVPRPDLTDPKVAAADALAHRWFGEKLGGLRGMSRPLATKRIQDLVDAQKLTPGLAALAAYDQFCREHKMAPKRPPADVREALAKLGLKR